MARPEVSWDFEEGTPIGEGRTILSRIGGGDLYDTYLVWDDRWFSIMVAKIIRPDRVDDSGAYRGLEREAFALQRLAHPLVVRSFDVVSDGEHPHILLEHLEGPSLLRLVRRRGAGLPMEQIIPLALHVASALHYFAGEGFVHLDVKPENIIMGVPPRLIDLSLVHSVEDAAVLDARVGTDAYMPPEQCDPEGPETIGPPADVWALAATLHYALTGEIPYPRPPREDRHTLADRFPQLEDYPTPLPDSVPAELTEVIERALARSPAERPTAQEFAGALEPLVAASPSRIVMTRTGWRTL